MTHTTKVYGPPGTGKTTWAINKVSEELTNGLSPYEIIYTSFTRAAAHEARDRALDRFKSYTKDEFPYFSTMHSICFKLMDMTRDSIFTGNKVKLFCSTFGYEVTGDSQDVTELTDSDLPQMILSTVADYYEFFISWMRNTCISFKEAIYRFGQQPGVPDGFNERDLRMYIERRNDYKQQNNLFDFTDLIEVCLINGLYPDKSKVLIQDEYQDLSPLMAKLSDMWASHMERVYLIGDAYQAVYCFMGADPNIFIKSTADETMVLKQSHRCSSAIHDVSRKLVNRFKTRYPDDDFTATSDQGLVTRQVAEAIDWKNIKGTVFYLHRTNWLLSKAFAQLIQDGIPFCTTKGRMSPLQTSKAKAVNSLMQLINGKEITFPEILKIMELIPTKTDKGNYLKMGAKAEAKELKSNKSIQTVTINDLPNLGFQQLFIDHITKGNPVHTLKLENDERNYFSRLISRYGYGVLNSNPSITLSTIHGVKGRECDTVILNTNLTRLTYDSLMNDPEPEHRLFYVGVTRAKTKLILLAPDDYESYTI